MNRKILELVNNREFQNLTDYYGKRTVFELQQGTRLGRRMPLSELENLQNVSYEDMHALYHRRG